MSQMTGYPSIDKPWIKFYSKEAINDPLPECTIYEYLWENNKNHLDETAIIYYNKKITYGELFHHINCIASAFKDVGVKENDVVTLMVLSQPETIYCLYALNKIGAISCMINVLSSPKEIVHYMKECDSKYLVVLDALFEKAHAAFKLYPMAKMIYLPMYQSLGMVRNFIYRIKVKKPVDTICNILSWRQFSEKAKELSTIANRNIHSCAVIGHTGGTTGTPKGVMLSDFAVNALASQYSNKLDFQRKDTFLSMIVLLYLG